MTASLRAMLLAATGALVAVGLGLSAIASARVQHPDYVGHIGASKALTDRQSRILIRVDGRGKNRTVTFQALNYKVICDDGRELRSDSSPRSVSLGADGRFTYNDYHSDTQSQDQSLYQFQGRLLPTGRARGFVALIVDPWDPPDGDNLAECSTLGELKWRAKRVRKQR